MLASVSLLLMPQLCFAWGTDGHRMINRLAIEKLPPDTPEFLRSKAAIEEIEYLGPEPDRWRGPNEPELSVAGAPEHFIDLELADLVGILPRRRYDFIAALYAAGMTHPDKASQLRPEKVGMQPWAANEVYQRLQAALRAYREQKAKGEDARPVEAAAIFYAGWLGHYVGDGSMPLHTSIHYNGWVGKENPQGYVTSPGIHSQFESGFVHRNLKAADVAPLMTAVQPLNDPFADYVAYLRHSNTLVERVYEIEKVQGFEGNGTSEAKQFTAERLAAGASELRDMIETAWQQSAKPEPERHEGVPVPRSTAPRACPCP
jgi:S1/P1 Nuclease